VSHDGRRYNNADEDRVELVDYDPGWPALFEAEAARLRAILASLELGSFRLEHFGSTAIPGITAKPIIDIMLVSAEQPRWPGLIEPIKSLDYVYWEEKPRGDRTESVKGMPPSAGADASRPLCPHTRGRHPRLVFRDYLRDDSDARMPRRLRAAPNKGVSFSPASTDREAGVPIRGQGRICRGVRAGHDGAGALAARRPLS
jgi:GrpB-like predicted nucleotidyltransferase (UPF0157 family)